MRCVAVFALARACRLEPGQMQRQHVALRVGHPYALDFGDVFQDARDSGPLFSERLKSPFQSSDEEPLATDRPDFTEASSVVGRGRVLLEGAV